MDTQLLRAFVTVAETASVSLSAQIMSLSQPALTRQLKRLEEQLGATLFTCGGGAVNRRYSVLKC